MELNVVTDGLKTLMHKLTELLQQSLVSNVDDNANTVADTIVEIITFGNKLSVETNSVIKRARKHEADLVSCLKQMKDVIKIQKSQMLNYTSISASCKSTMTDAQPQSCTICEINERVSIQLKQEIDTLRCGADILRRQLKQSKCLLQAQQV